MKKNPSDNAITNPPPTSGNNGGKPGAKNACGPKTPAGKRRVRFNVRTHGFYSRELVVADEDRAEFEALKKGVVADLNPTTQLQLLGCERVVSAAWRYKLALRMEATRLKPQLDSSDRPESGEASTESARWYTAGRQELKNAARFLSDLREDIQANGDQHIEEQKDLIVKVFGSDFYNSLTQWGPINTSALLLSEHLQQHSERFKMPLLPGQVLPAEVLSAAGRLRWDMAVKVVDLKLHEVSEFRRLRDQLVREVESPQSVALDVVNRYVTSTDRELERTVAWYWQLLERGFEIAEGQVVGAVLVNLKLI